MGPGPGVPAIVPSAGPCSGTSFPPRGPVGPVPPLPRYYEVLRLLSVLPASLRCLRLAVPRVRRWFAPADERRAAGGPGVWSSVPRPTPSRGDAQASQVPGEPSRAHALVSGPGEIEGPGLCGTSMRPSAQSTASALAMIRLTGLHPTACTLPVYASQPGSLPCHATFGSGRWPAFAGRALTPAGFRRRFPPSRTVHGFLLLQVFLAQ